MSGSNPVQGLAGLGAAHQHAARDAERKSVKPPPPRQVNRVGDSVEFEDAATHATSEDGGKRRQQARDQQQDQQQRQNTQDPGPEPGQELDLQG